MSREGEAYMPPAMVRRVLESVPDGVVLIGGQALAYWMDFYRVRQPSDLPAISRDVDFYTPDAADASPLQAFAKAIGGTAQVRSIRALSALIGSAVAPAEQDRIYNVDLLHDIVGIAREPLEANAVLVSLPGLGRTFRVMHPLDVLRSRNANLYQLAEKQDEIGKLQLRLAIEVARKFLEAKLDEVAAADLATRDRDRAGFDLIDAVSDLSREDAAKKNAKRYGIHVADAIPAWRISSPLFWSKQWPRLRSRMSQPYAALCEERTARRS